MVAQHQSFGDGARLYRRPDALKKRMIGLRDEEDSHLTYGLDCRTSKICTPTCVLSPAMRHPIKSSICAEATG